MNAGKTLFAELMDFVPWSTFTRLVTRYDGDIRVRSLSCGEQYRAMAAKEAQRMIKDEEKDRGGLPNWSCNKLRTMRLSPNDGMPRAIQITA